MTRNANVTQNRVSAVYHAPIPGQVIVQDVLVTSGAYKAEVIVVNDRGQLPAFLTWRPAFGSKTCQPVEGQGVIVLREF